MRCCHFLGRWDDYYWIERNFFIIHIGNSGEKEFDGQAHNSRPMRAHWLVQVALVTLFIESLLSKYVTNY